MNMYRKLIVTSAFLAGCIMSHAQNSPVSAGGDATGATGNVSYSVGQVNYITIQSGEGTVTQGVQQPYEIFTIGLDEPGIDLQISAFPNPTNSSFTLRILDMPLHDMKVKLFDIQGRCVYDGRIVAEETSISMDNYAEATYILKVLRGSVELEAFKIVKSQ